MISHSADLHNYGLCFSTYVKRIQLNVAFVYIDQDYIGLDYLNCFYSIVIVFILDNFEYTIPYNI